MKKQLILILCLIFLCGLIQGFRELTKKGTEKSAPPQLPVKPKILTFYEEGWGGIYRGSWARLQEVKDKVDVVSPVWLGLRADGQVNWDRTNAATIAFFAQNKLDFVVLVTAGSGRSGSSILAYGNHRQNALHSIAAYVKRVKAGGVCLDFEYINPALKKDFIQFVKELKATLAGKKLLVAVFPYVNWTEPTKETYDYHSLDRICDGIIVMTYDQHRPQDTPGPIASRGWVEDNLAYFLTQIDARKLWLGIAGYGYQWRTGSDKAVALPAWYCREKAIQKGITDTYHPEAGNDYMQFTEKGGAYTIWWEGFRGMKEKLAMAAKHNLAGVALWRLGYEEKEFWEYQGRP